MDADMLRGMITCKQHLPAYFDPVNIERQQWTFADVAEMLRGAQFACWRDDPKFHRFSLADIGSNPTLMVELAGGRTWWVIGYLSADDPNELAPLPKWKAVK